MAVLMRIVALATVPGLPDDTEHAGRYLRDYDPDAYRGRGRIRTTDDPAHAMRFPDLQAAMECWRRQSRTVPLRDDGRPNRPLTAYTVTTVPTLDA